MMGIILVALHVVVCFLLIAVILLQAGRGQGLAGANFSSGNVQSLLGTRSADFLTKATTVAAILFLFTCIGLDILEAQRSRSLFNERRPTAPVDAQQIQKILEKIRTEGASGIPAPATQPAASKPVPVSLPAPAPAAKTPKKE